jgi:hypothetical protein
MILQICCAAQRGLSVPAVCRYSFGDCAGPPLGILIQRDLAQIDAAKRKAEKFPAGRSRVNEYTATKPLKHVNHTRAS